MESLLIALGAIGAILLFLLVGLILYFHIFRNPRFLDQRLKLETETLGRIHCPNCNVRLNQCGEVAPKIIPEELYLRDNPGFVCHALGHCKKCGGEYVFDRKWVLLELNETASNDS